MKKIFKKSRRKGNGAKILVWILLILLSLVVMYWAKSHEQFGQKRFVHFSLPYCREPLFFSPKKITSPMQDIKGWVEFKDTDLGFLIKKPETWKIDNSCGAHACVNSPDLFFPEHGGQPQGGRITITRVPKTHNFEEQPFYYGRVPTNIYSFAQALFSCHFVEINGAHAVQQIVDKPERRLVYFIEGDFYIYIVEPQVFFQNTTLENTLSAILASFTPVLLQDTKATDPYTGNPSPQVPYKGLDFPEVDISSTRQIADEFSRVDMQLGERIKGYTFLANYGEKIEFTMIVPGSINMMNDTTMELYSYGPTVLRGENRLEWRPPVTGRYFLVVKDVSGNMVSRSYLLRIGVSY